MTAVEVGVVVTLTELDSEPALSVLAVDEDIMSTLVADLADETTERLELDFHWPTHGLVDELNSWNDSRVQR